MKTVSPGHLRDPITTKRLRLVPFTEAHVTDRYVSWLNDPLVVRYSERRHVHHDRGGCLRYLRSFEGTPHEFRAIVVDAPEVGHIGNITAHVDERWEVADVGILVGDTTQWGRGYATEAWSAFCRYLLEERSMRKVTAGTLDTNQTMLTLMRRTGMVEDGRRRRQALWEGREVDLVHAALFRSPATGERPGPSGGEP